MQCLNVLIWNNWFSNNSFKLLFIKSIKGLLIVMVFFLVAGMLWNLIMVMVGYYL